MPGKKLLIAPHRPLLRNVIVVSTGRPETTVWQFVVTRSHATTEPPSGIGAPSNAVSSHREPALIIDLSSVEPPVGPERKRLNDRRKAVEREGAERAHAARRIPRVRRDSPHA